MPSRVVWQLAADQGAICSSARRRLARVHRNQTADENPPVIARGLARVAKAHALERLRWDRLGVPVLFCTGVGVAENRQRCERFRLSRPKRLIDAVPPPDSGVVPFSGKST